MYNVAVLLKNGTGTTQNLEKALEWAKKAEKAGMEDSTDLIEEINDMIQQRKAEIIAKMTISEAIQDRLINNQKIKLKMPSPKNEEYLNKTIKRYAWNIHFEDILGFVDVSTVNQTAIIIVTKDAIYSNLMRIKDYRLPVVGIKDFAITFDRKAIRFEYWCQLQYEVEMTEHIDLFAQILVEMVNIYEQKEPKMSHRAKKSKCEIQLLPATRFKKMPVNILICGCDEETHATLLTLFSKYASQNHANVAKKILTQSLNKFDISYYTIEYKGITYIFNTIATYGDEAFKEAMRKSENNGFLEEVDPFDAYIYVEEERYSYMDLKYVPEKAVLLGLYFNKKEIDSFGHLFNVVVDHLKLISRNQVSISIGNLDEILDGEDTAEKCFATSEKCKDLNTDFKQFLFNIKDRLKSEVLLPKFIKQKVLDNSVLGFKEKEDVDSTIIKKAISSFEPYLKRKDILLFKDCSEVKDGSKGIIITKDKIYSHLIENETKSFAVDSEMQVSYDVETHQIHLQYSNNKQESVLINDDVEVFKEVLECYQKAHQDLKESI